MNFIVTQIKKSSLVQYSLADRTVQFICIPKPRPIPLPHAVHTDTTGFLPVHVQVKVCRPWSENK